MVEGAYPIPSSEFGGVRVVTCPDWALGPGASLRCGLAALGDDVEAALSCSPTGRGSTRARSSG